MRWIKYTNGNYSRKMCSRIDLQTHAGNALDNCVTLAFDLLTLGFMLAKHLPYTICLPSLVLSAHTQSRMRLITLFMHRLLTTGVGIHLNAQLLQRDRLMLLDSLDRAKTKDDKMDQVHKR